MFDYNVFMKWLDDHNYCKVTPCASCTFWTRFPGGSPEGRCRYHRIKTWQDDYCSDAMSTGENKEG